METQESGFQLPLTIKEVVNSVHSKKYLLPAIQREFVWNPKQVIKLFDSLMRGYPIGSFLFWNVSKEKIKEFQFYEFIRDYHERTNRHNPKADILKDEEVIAILDGQQRLTALYIALRGSYAFKKPRMFKNNPLAYPKTKLYLNLLNESEDYEMKYNFEFLTEEEAINNDENYWFEVGKILDFGDIKNIYDFLFEEGIVQSKQASDALFELFAVFTQKKIINFYLENSQELEKVLNIFIRVNSGGTILSYSDLLLSIAAAQWKTRDAREEINLLVDGINQIGNNFEFDKDFVLKSCLILSDITGIAFKVDNFNSANMKRIEDAWDDISMALKLAIELVSSFGYNFQTLTSNNAVIPIAYYIMKLGNPTNFVGSSNHKEDRTNIKKWFMLSLVKRAFSGQPDNVLRPIRKIIQENEGSFPVEKIIDKFKGTNKSLIFTEEDVETLLYSKYGQGHTFSILALIYPNLDYRNKFHQDHIFPKSWFTLASLRKKKIEDEKMEVYLNNFNYLGNLQLLEGLPNEEKSNKDFKEWVEKTYSNDEEKRNYKNQHFIPKDISLDFNNFGEFVEQRNDMIKTHLMKILTK